jgi:hypothetical protein
MRRHIEPICATIRVASLALATAVLLLLTGCPTDPEPTDAPRSWTVEQEHLEGALLSIFIEDSGDIWLAGADRNGKGPTLMHGDGAGKWTTLEPGGKEGLWWVFSRKAGEIWAVGDKGRVLRHDVAAGTFVDLPSPTTATLYGIWGAADGPLWAVGGFVFDSNEAPVLLKIDGDKVEAMPLPAEIKPSESLFKVWGTAADNVWIIGDKGTALRWDGKALNYGKVDGKPRLVTVHGSAKDDVVIVGGAMNAQLFEGKGDGTWVDKAPVGLQSLNGVHVRSDGKAAAAGMGGTTMERKGGTWNELPLPDSDADWHGVWYDDGGDIWVVGGNLGSITAMDDGAVLRYGP